MAVTIIVEDGSIVENANSYRTLDQLKAHFEGHAYGAAVLAKSDDDLKKGLVQTFREINTAATWRGVKCEWNQKGAFPRVGLWPDAGNVVQPVAPENLNIVTTVAYDGGEMCPPDKIPDCIGDAQCELVRFTLASDRGVESDGAAVKREKLDVLEVEYQNGAKRDPIPDVVQRMFAPFAAVLADDAPIGGAPAASAVLMTRAS